MMPQEEMLKHLVQQVADRDPLKVLQQTEKTVDEVILQSDVDGVSYYLVRCRPKSNAWIDLSPREQEISKLVAQGLPNKCIGSKLDISPWTVATYLRRIFGKLGVTSRTEMITRLMAEN